MKPCAFGTETEFGLFVESTGRVRPEAKDIAETIIRDFAEKYKHVPSPTPPRRLFLMNGACVYVDAGGHPEIATAECTNPIDLSVQNLALRQMLAESVNSVAKSYGSSINRIWLLANNLDYALKGACSYGYHLNVYVNNLALEQAANQLEPLLAAMPIIAGTGKASFTTTSGGFELSQRADFMTMSKGRRTRDSRAMITVKDEALDDEGIRLHLICFDTPKSIYQIALVPAIIAMALKMLESGRDIASSIALEYPSESLRAVSCDPSLSAKLRLKNGGYITALEIHDHYIHEVGKFINQKDAPCWFEQMLKLWSEIVDNLRKGISLEVGRLDWVTKLVIFTKILEQAGLTWPEYSKWIYVLSSIRRFVASGFIQDPPSSHEMKEKRMRIPESARVLLDDYVTEHGLSWKTFPKIWTTAMLFCNRCLAYHALHPVTKHKSERLKEPLSLITDQMIMKARTSAPKGTRAEIRGKAIQNAKPGSTAWWTFIQEVKRRLEMPDVLGKRSTWKEIKILKR